MTNERQELTREITNKKDLADAISVFPKAKIEFAFYNQATSVGYYSAEVGHVTLFLGNYDTKSPQDGFYDLKIWLDEEVMPSTDKVLSGAIKKLARKIGIHQNPYEDRRYGLGGPYGFCNPKTKTGEYRRWKIGELRSKILTLEDFLNSIKYMSKIAQDQVFEDLSHTYARIRGRIK